MKDHAPILLAEDHPVNQKVALILLERFGYTADAVSSGRAAVDAYRDNDYELILMDVMMPDMDGFEATRMIRAEEQSSGKHVPIIALTAMAMVGDRDRCIEAGMDDYITKPIDPELLKAKINSWLASGVKYSHTHPSPNGEEPLLDWDQLKRTYSAEQIDEILRMFLNITSALCQEVELAVQRDDWAAAERTAHEIKGSSAAIYAAPLQRSAFQLEQASKGDHSLARELCIKVRQQFALLEKLINSTCANRGR